MENWGTQRLGSIPVVREESQLRSVYCILRRAITQTTAPKGQSSQPFMCDPFHPPALRPGSKASCHGLQDSPYFPLIAGSLGTWASHVALVVKNSPVRQETQIQIPGSGRSPGGGNGSPLRIAWRILWTEEPGRLMRSQFMGTQSWTWLSVHAHACPRGVRDSTNP